MEIKKNKNWSRQNHSALIIWGLLSIIVIFAIILRFYHIGKLSFWTDEIATFKFATYSFKDMLKADPNMSLYYMLTHYWIGMFPNRSEALLRSISAIFSVASIPVVFLLGRKLGANKKQAIAIGLTAAFLVTINAFHIQYAQEFRSYSLVFLLTSLSTFLLIKAIEQQDSLHYWVLYTIVSVAAIYSHFLVVFLLVVQAVTLPILLLEKSHPFPFRKIMCSGIAMILLILPIVVVVHSKGASQIAWIAKPTLNDGVNFTMKITGNQGVLLASFYFLTIAIGLLAGIKAFFRKDIITKWKFILVASCLFLPVFMVFLFSEEIIPIYQAEYLLFILPYAAILASIGIVFLVTLGWNKRDDRIARTLIGIVLLGEIVSLSGGGIKTYFEHFKKEDWRGASQFMTKKCSTSLRLYYMTFIENNAIYYDKSLESQVVGWDRFINKNPSSEEIAKFLPRDYNQVCLITKYDLSVNYNEQKNIQLALKVMFPKETKINKFYTVDVEIYRR